MTPAPRKRSLLPREHGAWVQLGLPAACALGLGAPTAPAVGLAAAALLVFLAHEPLLVTLGHRGRRARDAEAERARRWLVGLALAAAAVGAPALALSPAATWAALAAALVPAALVWPLVRARRERSTAGELGVAVALAGVSLPVGLAAGLSWRVAATCWLFWVATLVVETLAARAVLARGRKGATDRRPAVAAGALAAAGLAGGAAAAAAGLLAWAWVAAFVPAAAVAGVAAALPVGPRALMAVGLTMLAGGLAALAVLWLAPIA